MFDDRLTPVYYLCSIFLTWPLKYFTNNLFIYSLFSYVIPAVLFIVYSFLVAVSFNLISTFSYVQADKLIKIVDKLISYGAILMFYCFQIYNLIMRFHLRKILLDIDMLCKDNFGHYKINSIKCLNELIALFIIFIIYSVIECTVFQNQVDNYNTVSYLAYNYPIFTCMIQLYSVIAIIRTYKLLYIKMNNNLLQMNTSKISSSRIINYRAHFDIVYLKSLSVVAEQHIKIVKAAYYLNDYFGPIFLYFVGYVFCGWVVYLKYIFNMASEVFFYHKEHDITLATWNVIWIWIIGFILWTVVYFWVNLRDEANKTALLIHELWNKYAGGQHVQLQVDNLQLISLQLLHGKLKFTACGFFPLNYSLLYMIIGAVTTYVVILMQFDSMSKPTS